MEAPNPPILPARTEEAVAMPKWPSLTPGPIDLAASCSDLGRFEAELRAIPRPPEPWDPADEPEPTPDEMG